MRLTRDGFLTAILVVAALFVGSFVTSYLPQSDRLVTDTPFVHEVGIGETAHLRSGEVTVTGVSTAKRVQNFANVSEAAGVWLIVDLEFEPIGERGLIGGALPVVIAADGRLFGGSQAVATNCGPTPPRMPVACQLAFEIAGDALEGAHLRIPAGDSVYISDDVADVNLGIDTALAASLAVTDEQVTLMQPQAVVR